MLVCFHMAFHVVLWVFISVVLAHMSNMLVVFVWLLHFPRVLNGWYMESEIHILV
jgi:hypothetical protein